jgi:hypothetical protein
MKPRTLRLSTPTCALYLVTLGIGFLGGLLCFASMASIAGSPGYPWWPVVLLTVLWVVTLVVGVAVGVTRCPQVRQRGAGRADGGDPDADGTAIVLDANPGLLSGSDA